MPTLITLNITGFAKDAASSPLTGNVVFRPFGVFGADGVVVPTNEVTAVINGVTGAFSTNLYTVNIAGAFVRYLVAFPNGDTSSFDLAATSPTTLDALLNLSPITDFERSEMLTALQTLIDQGGTLGVPTTRTVNGKALTSNITLNSDDIGIGEALASHYANAQAAVTAIAGSNINLSVASTALQVPLDTTLPINVNTIVKGGTIYIAAGKRLTVLGDFTAPPQLVFTGPGTVDFSNSRNRVVRPEWWGAVGQSNTDSTAAIMAAVNSLGSTSESRSGKVLFSDWGYKFTQLDLTGAENIALEGTESGWNGGRITLECTGAVSPAINLTSSAAVEISKCRFKQSNAAFSGYFIQGGSTGHDTSWLDIHDNSFVAPTGTVTAWIDLSYVILSEITSNNFIGGGLGIIGRRIGYSIANNVSLNSFNAQTVACIRNIGESWTVSLNKANGGVPLIDDSGEGFYSQGSTINTNYFEGGGGGSKWISMRMIGGVISGHEFTSLAGGGGSKMIELIGDSQGVAIIGNRFNDDVSTIAVAGNSSQSGIVLIGNDFTSTTPYAGAGFLPSLTGNRGISPLSSDYSRFFTASSLAVTDGVTASNNTAGIDFGFRTATNEANTSAMFGVLVSVAGFPNRSLAIQPVKNGDTAIVFLASDGSEIGRMTKAGGLAMATPVSIPSSAPVTATAAGVAGTITWDSGFLYICTATNTWKRVAIAAW